MTARAPGQPTLRRQPGRTIVLTVSRDVWDRLVVAAAASDRDPYQQARWLLVRALGAPPADDDRQQEAAS